MRMGLISNHYVSGEDITMRMGLISNHYVSGEDITMSVVKIHNVSGEDITMSVVMILWIAKLFVKTSSRICLTLFWQ